MENICLCEGLGPVRCLPQSGWREITVSLAPLLLGVCFTHHARTRCSRFAETLGGRVGCDPFKLAGLGVVRRPVSEAAAQVVKRRRVKPPVIVGVVSNVGFCEDALGGMQIVGIIDFVPPEIIASHRSKQQALPFHEIGKKLLGVGLGSSGLDHIV